MRNVGGNVLFRLSHELTRCFKRNRRQRRMLKPTLPEKGIYCNYYPDDSSVKWGIKRWGLEAFMVLVDAGNS
jgi:hypothetical protein